MVGYRLGLSEERSLKIRQMETEWFIDCGTGAVWCTASWATEIKEYCNPTSDEEKNGDGHGKFVGKNVFLFGLMNNEKDTNPQMKPLGMRVKNIKLSNVSSV
ncbi:hypothetical protein CEXT_706461 [Caerostris extrusa]|uniref:Peptidase A1 domain-containing protein n=1 Tax=Caerostris extrusa TaxID=172846 RepID=A0AAV4S9X2_CAEEX|nr:hypothetical protein CEXT_706461 [Caerostris extrusa]